MFPVRIIEKKEDVATVYSITYTAGRNIEHLNANIYNRLNKTPRTSISNHLHDLAAVDDAGKTLRVHLAVDLASQELVPPPKEEVARDELEPRRERVGCRNRTRVSARTREVPK